MYYAYVIRNAAGVLYKGFTSDLEKRLQQHNAHNFDSYTSGRGPWTLVYKEEFSSEREARQKEKFLKSGQGREFLKRILDDYPPQADG